MSATSIAIAGWMKAACSRGAVISALLHVCVLAALLVFARDRPLPQPDEGAVDVEIVSEPALTPEKAVMPQPVSAPVAPPAPQAQPEQITPVQPPPSLIPTVPPRAGGLVKAERMLAANVLKEPRNRQIAAAMPTLATEEQQRQLCAIEAVAQIAAHDAAFRPEKVISYATSPIEMRGQKLVAKGAAVLSHGQWYKLSFVCGTAGRRPGVNAFEYEIGDPIPRNRWAGYNLPAVVRSME